MRLQDIQKAVLVWGAISTEGVRLLAQQKSLVIVPEQRPGLIGLTTTAPRLAQAGVPFFYCTDNVLGLLFYKKKVRATYLFFEEKNDAGVRAPSGSLYAVLLSKLHGIPVVTMPRQAPAASGDPDAASLGGRRFVLPPHEKTCIIEAEPELIPNEVL